MTPALDFDPSIAPSAAWDVPETPRPATATVQFFAGAAPDVVREHRDRLDLELLDGVFWAGGRRVGTPRSLSAVAGHWDGAELRFDVPIDDALETRYVRLRVDGQWRFGVPISRRALRQDIEYVATSE